MHCQVNSETIPFEKPLKKSNVPGSDGISRSSRSSDDIVNVDACLGSLLVV